MPNPAASRRAAPRLYLVTPAADEGFAPALADALGTADVAAVLLRLKPDGERALINRIKALAQVTQPGGAALILDGHAGLVARAGADGAHLTGIECFTTECQGLKPDRIAGCGGLKTRHDAMLAAERGADYVMFGEPEPSGHRPSFEAILERVEWWAEVFEMPCVGFAASPDEAHALARAGADFIALGGAIWDRPAAAIADVVARLGEPETVP
jgi:thiamine-phosphate pyrophosphorylase